MLRVTEFSKENLCEVDVKRLLIDTCIECECDRKTIIYAIEDVDKFFTRMKRGDVSLWVLTDKDTFMMFCRILGADDVRHLLDIDEISYIKKMYRVERMVCGYNIVEVEFDK